MEDLRNIFLENSHSLVILDQSVLDFLKKGNGIFQTDRTFIDNDVVFGRNQIISLEKSINGNFWGKRSDLISFVKMSNNSYIIFRFNSVYVSPNTIHISKDTTERIIYLEE